MKDFFDVYRILKEGNLDGEVLKEAVKNTSGDHEWTLSFDGMNDFTATSIWRKKEEGTIRFWQKGTHSFPSTVSELAMQPLVI